MSSKEGTASSLAETLYRCLTYSCQCKYLNHGSWAAMLASPKKFFGTRLCGCCIRLIKDKPQTSCSLALFPWVSLACKFIWGHRDPPKKTNHCQGCQHVKDRLSHWTAVGTPGTTWSTKLLLADPSMTTPPTRSKRQSEDLHGDWFGTCLQWMFPDIFCALGFVKCQSLSESVDIACRWLSAAQVLQGRNSPRVPAALLEIWQSLMYQMTMMR